MSHGAAAITRADIPEIVRAKPFVLPMSMRNVLLLLVILGAGGFAWELVHGDAVHAWTALQVNFLYWLCLAAASTCFAARRWSSGRPASAATSNSRVARGSSPLCSGWP